MKQAAKKTREKRMGANFESVQRRECGGENRAMQSDSSVCKSEIEKAREVVDDRFQINGKKENSSGTEEILEGAPDGVVASRR